MYHYDGLRRLFPVFMFVSIVSCWPSTPRKTKVGVPSTLLEHRVHLPFQCQTEHSNGIPAGTDLLPASPHSSRRISQAAWSSPIQPRQPTLVAEAYLPRWNADKDDTGAAFPTCPFRDPGRRRRPARTSGWHRTLITASLRPYLAGLGGLDITGCAGPSKTFADGDGGPIRRETDLPSILDLVAPEHRTTAAAF